LVLEGVRGTVGVVSGACLVAVGGCLVMVLLRLLLPWLREKEERNRREKMSCNCLV